MKNLIDFIYEYKIYWLDESWHKTYYTGLQKNKVVIFFDIIMWFFKHGEFNGFYYAYGLNIVNSDMNFYMPYKSFMLKRNQLNHTSPKYRGKDYTIILKDKQIFSNYFTSFNIPVLKNKYLIKNNKMVDLDNHYKVTVDEFLENNTGQYFCKVIDGECGIGAFSFGINDDKTITINGIVSSYDKLKGLMLNNYIVQEIVKQNNEMNKIYPQSVNTIRIVTINNHRDDIYISNAQFRCGVDGNITDNWARGGISIGINVNNGKLFEYGVYKPGYGTLTKNHPNTKFVFMNYKLPFWGEVKNLVINAHYHIDKLYTIGWDVAILESGPIIIEGNENWEISHCQATLMGKFGREDVNKIFEII